jgi:hypothetical protein
MPPPPDKTPPTLVEHTPQSNEENVWAGAPIRLLFSEPLAAASMASSPVTVETAVGPVATRTSLSDDGREIRVVIESPHFGPSRVTVTVATTLTDLAGNKFAGATWSFAVPLWQIPGGGTGASGNGPLRPSLALDATDNPVLAWQDGAAVRVARVASSQWRRLGDMLNVRADAVASAPRIAVTSANEPVVVWQESSAEKHVYAKQFRNGRWEALGEGPIDAGAGQEGALPVVVVDAKDRPIVAWIEDQKRVLLRRWDGQAWRPFWDAWDADGAVSDVTMALSASGPVVAAAVAGASSTDVRVVRWPDTSASLRVIGAPLDRAIDNTATRPTLAVSPAGEIGVAWQENDSYSDNVYAARYDEGEQRWMLLGHALDIEFDATATGPSIGFAADGTPSVAWNELHAEGAHTYVARFAGTEWVVPGAGLNREKARSATSAALVLDRAGSPVVAWEEPAEGDGGTASQVASRRYNGGAELPYGSIVRHAAPCSFPLEGAPDFPRTLTETHCFADVPGRVPAEGLVPYDVNSPLWSDGALKRRFIILPEGGAVGFTETFAWQLPTGTILVKEFLLEREPGNPATIYPMETRFLVKRCEPGSCKAAWEGYSYQWNDIGSEATLLDNEPETVFKEWPTGSTLHRHGYPGRIECRQCHVNAAGFVLGLQTGQMNRNFDYGDTVDNQIRAWMHAGMFRSETDGGTGADGRPDDAGTNGGPSDANGASDAGASDANGGTGGGGPTVKLQRFPVPGDPAYTNTERVRSYFHANCSHCHRPDGRWPVIDFLYDAPLVGENEGNANICNELVPGNASQSRIYIKDSVREGNLPPDFFGDPMPPLATWVVDERQVPTLRNWINEMKSCP